MKNEQKIDFGKNAILISRVSTPEQVLLQDLMPQLEDLKVYAQSLGYKNFYPVGTTESGFLEEDEKQGWHIITDYIAKHPSYRTIICTELSRLSRVESILYIIRDYLCENKIQLIVKDIGFTLLDEFGNADFSKKLVFSLYASLASSEMATKRERFKRALKEYRKQGYSIGGKELFGYTRVYDFELSVRKKARYIENPNEAEEIRTIYKWYAYGINEEERNPSIFKITKECIARGMSTYLHSKRNVNKCLKETAYIGFKITKNKRKNPQYWNYKKLDEPKYIDADSYECTYPQIVDKELFDIVQDLLMKRSSHNIEDNDRYVDKSNKHTTILSKLLVCPSCGKYMVGEYRIDKKGQIKHTYRCANSRGVVHLCSFRAIPSMIQLDSVIWAYVKTSVSEIVRKRNKVIADIDLKEEKNAILRLQSKVDSYEGEIDIASTVFTSKMRRATTPEYRKKVQSEYEDRLNLIERERERFQREIRKRKERLKSLQQQGKTMKVLAKQDLSEIENNKEEMYKYIHLLIDRVIPVYVDRQFTVLEVESYHDKSNVVFSSDKNMKNKKNKWDLTYLFIDKRNTNKLKVYVADGWVGWNSEANELDIDECIPITAEELCNLDWEHDGDKIMSIMGGNWSVRVLPYKRLSFYEEDYTSTTPDIT